MFGSDESSHTRRVAPRYVRIGRIRPKRFGSRAMSLALRKVDLERFDRALTTILSPLAHQRCDDWRVAVESSVAELLDGDHVVFGIPRSGVAMHVHATNIAAQPQRAIQTLFGGLPELPADEWLRAAERERERTRAQVWSRIRAFWRVTAGLPAAR